MAASGPIISNMLLVGGSIDNFQDQKKLGISLGHATNQFPDYISDFHVYQGSARTVSYENERVKINIFAQNLLPEKRGSLLCSYVKIPDVIVLCVDMEDKNSLGLAKKYLNHFDKITPVIIAGTNCLSDKRELELKDLEELRAFRQYPICLTDAKYIHGIDELLNTIANEHVKFHLPDLHSKYTEKTQLKQESSSKKNKMNLFSFFESKDQKKNKLINKKPKKEKSKSQKMSDKKHDKPKAP